MKKVIAVLIMAAIIMSLAVSCNGLTRKNLVAVWEFDITFAEAYDLDLEDDDAFFYAVFGENGDFSDKKIDYRLRFNEEGGYTLGVDGTKISETMNEIMDDYIEKVKSDKSILMKTVQASLSHTLTEQEFDDMIKGQGYDSYEDYAAFMLMKFEDEGWIKELANQYQMKFTYNGKYTIDDNTVYLSEDKEDYVTIEYSKDEIEITAAGGICEFLTDRRLTRKEK